MKALLYPSPTKINLIDLSVKKRFYLAAFLKAAPLLNSNGSNGIKLSPTEYSDHYIFKYLLDKSIISVYTGDNVQIESLDLFLHTKNEHITIDINVFSTNLADNQLLSNFYNPVISKCNQSELEDLTEEVLVLECFEFIREKLKCIGISFNFSHEIFEQIKDTLKYFSASQFCYLYWDQVKSLCYQRSAGRINSVQLVENSISTTISYLKKAKKENWRVSGYYRDSNHTPSILSNLILTYQYTWRLKSFYKIPNSSRNLQLHVELNPDCCLDPNKQFIKSNGDIINSLTLQ